VAETLQQPSGENEFQVASDADTLDAGHAAAHDPIQTGGDDLAFIEPSPELRASMQVPFISTGMVPEDPEPAVAEPEPVVTEAMAELYASQGHLNEALDVYRQLAARNPDDHRIADRMVELEMFAGASQPAMSEMVDMVEEAPAPAPMMPDPAASLDEMELTPAEPAPARRPSGPVAGVTVGSWLAEVFAQALPSGGGEAHELVEAPAPVPIVTAPAAAAAPPAPVAPAAPASDVAPLGSPTRPASGNFSLSNVFGEGNQNAPTAKTGSFDAFFGAPTASSPATPAASPAGPSTRSTRPSSSATPPSDDDLSSFQDWLQGLKK